MGDGDRPTAVIVDLGLPDGSGLDLIRDLAAARPRVTSIIATSGLCDAEADAIAAGADAFLAKPLSNLAVFQQAVLSTLPEDRRPSGPRILCNPEVRPDPLAYRDDMVHVSNLLDEHPDGPVLDYIAQFIGGVARSADDGQLARAAEALADRQSGDAHRNRRLAELAGLVQERLTARAAM